MNRKKLVSILFLVLIAVLSCTKIKSVASNPDNHSHSIEQMEENISTVMKLSAGSAAASVALTLLPSDVATPIADQLADLSKYFLVILSALYLEKYLITLSGWVSFTVLVPASCVILIGYLCTQKKFLLQTALRILGFSFLICAAVPTSVAISDVIYRTQETGINDTLDTLDEFDVSDAESGSVLSQITSAVRNAADRATTLFTDLIEAMAVLLVISCLIPVLVILFYVWLIKMVFRNPPN